MRKMRHTLAMLLALAMLLTGISYQPAISNAAAKPKLSNKSITITVGKSKKITVKKRRVLKERLSNTERIEICWCHSHLPYSVYNQVNCAHKKPYL